MTTYILPLWGYLFYFILMSWECFTSSTFFFCNEPIWLAHSKKKLKLLRLPKIKDSMKRWSASPFGLPLAQLYRWEGGKLWAKHMGLTQGAIGNTLRAHVGNLRNTLRTWNEPIENLKGTCWNKRKMKKILPSPSPTCTQNFFLKNQGTSSAC